ncbi:DNA polymerase subunit gamma-1, mitochondrial [Rhagoletis pomonella]|uniref:DNA polymerase subunit gamma-1, mitochondrial n=1 Tax=Rhagoletis pomonella TaxID=28610 RepID=UPI001785A783|nr:DNA polymerase subunit gamma-1, mitochondrial [Rhagoletis pomonella]
MLFLRCYSTKIRDVYPHSTIKVFRSNKLAAQPPCNTKARKTDTNIQASSIEGVKSPKLNENEDYAENAVKVQMISRCLHRQIFKKSTNSKAAEASIYIAELKKHGIDVHSTDHLPDVNLQLPKLHGKDIEEHFYTIAKKQVAPYERLIDTLVTCKTLPARPAKWCFQSGWTVYDANTGEGQPISIPPENALVLDVEVCMSEGAAPTLAAAVGTKNWYSWVSPNLTDIDTIKSKKHLAAAKRYFLKDLIPLGTKGPKIIVGHNVSYDRARLREQYLIEDIGTRFVDTMSLHISVSGITSYQRALLKSQKEADPEDEEWQAQSSLNSLVDVHRLYCGGELLSKEPRNIFLEGTLSDVKDNFQMLMGYCAGDVEATYNVFTKLYTMYSQRFPHPATLAGMLELGSAYLPVNSNWTRYLKESDLAYEDLSIEAKNHLSRRADSACRLMKDEAYRENLWLWDEDWSVQGIKLKKTKCLKKDTNKTVKRDNSDLIIDKQQDLQKKFQYLYDTKSLLPARRPLLPGYPAWYRKLCNKPPKNSTLTDAAEDWSPGATQIGTGMQIAPKLLSLCWEGYPLHYIREYGWGFLVPFRGQPYPPIDLDSDASNPYRIPIKKLIERCPVPKTLEIDNLDADPMGYDMGTLNKELESKLGKRDYFKKQAKDHTNGIYQGAGIWCKKILEGCCFFLKLPHKNGNSFRVGNPLSKDFLNKFSENVLSSGDAGEGSAKRVIDIARMMSYWRNNRDRIMGQLVIWFNKDDLPQEFKSNGSIDDIMEYGAICPQVVACGTLTRRAMEPTWMTASNSQRERIGSELRSMVQAPAGYRIVGADVDSQELWIASVLGDAYACGIHGATPLGWMTISGSKSNGTDMHSITAKAVGISRDHAKVINYARIYGAGQNFAEGLLKQFNPTLSDTEARSKSQKMFAITKGKRVYKLREEFADNYDDRNYSGYEALKLAAASNRAVKEMFHIPRWVGGTESAMFNRLEEIALSECPKTPFLNCRLSRALEVHGGDENRFLPTRVNWVVQSGAVDFLHLMLVCMRWLMGTKVRFSLSFHDEVRYLVKEELAYKTALALHITNLLTRSFCSSRLGLTDLPMSVAFFSSVEVDTALRKDSNMDCKTPSNPHGLHIGYGIPPGESLNIYDAISKAEGGDLNNWPWLK